MGVGRKDGWLAIEAIEEDIEVAASRTQESESRLLAEFNVAQRIRKVSEFSVRDQIPLIRVRD